MSEEKYYEEDTAQGRDSKPVVVRNRDIPLLAGVLYIVQEIRMLEVRRDWQRDMMYNITQHLSAMPHGGGLPRGLDSAFAELSEIDAEHEARCKQYVRQLRKAEHILNGITSQTMRTFVLMRYVMDRPDTEIRDQLNMTRRGFDRARTAVESASCMAQVRWQERYIFASNTP